MQCIPLKEEENTLFVAELIEHQNSHHICTMNRFLELFEEFLSKLDESDCPFILLLDSNKYQSSKTPLL